MSLKDLFWKGGGEEGGLPAETTSQEAESLPSPIRRSQTPTASSLAVLRTGPTASIFARTTGLQTVVSPPASVNHTAVDREFDEVIAGALEQDAKAPGLKEFMAQLVALSAIIPDRGQCVKADLVAITATNLSLNATVVARAIGERLKLLSGYQTSYDTDSRKSEEGETAEKRLAISEIESRLRDIDAEIQRLVGERAQSEQQRAQFDSELQGTGTKYDGYRTRFNDTVQARRAELKSLLNAVAPGATEREN